MYDTQFQLQWILLYYQIFNIYFIKKLSPKIEQLATFANKMTNNDTNLMEKTFSYTLGVILLCLFDYSPLLFLISYKPL
jgi:hypothetical protein